MTTRQIFLFLIFTVTFSLFAQALPPNSDYRGVITSVARFWGCDVQRPLFQAICKDNLIEVKKLIDQGGSPNEFAGYPTSEYENHLDVLTLATSLQFNDIALYLLEKGANPNFKGVYFNTPFHAAVIMGNKEMVTKYLDLYVNAYAEENYYGLTPLTWIAASDEIKIDRKLELLNIFLNHNVDLNRANQSGMTFLHWAVSQRDSGIQLTDLLLQHGADVNQARTADGQTPLLRAAYNLTLLNIKSLLKYGAKVNVSKNGQYTALCAPAAVSSFWNSDEKKYVNDIFQEIIGAGFNLFDVPCDNELRTPLMHLVKNGIFPNLVEQLISLGANMNALDSYGRTAVMYPTLFTFSCDQYCEEAAKILVNHGADLNVRYENKSALMQAADVFGNSKYGEYLIKHGAYLDFTDEKGNSALMLTLNGNLTSDRLRLSIKLIQAGADLKIKNSEGYSAIFFAAVRKNGTEVLKEIIIHGEDINQSHYGQTSLMLAARNDCIKNIKLLLNSGALVNLKDREGKTALFYAQSEAAKNLIIAAGGTL